MKSGKLLFFIIFAQCNPDVQVAAKDSIQMTEEGVKEALYMSDVDPNEACIHALMTGEALIVLFKMLDTDDRDFVSKLEIFS